LLNAFVNLVNRLTDIRVVRFNLSTCDVDMEYVLGIAISGSLLTLTTFGGLYLPGPIGSAS
jgi:hypothetical protein